MAIATRQKTGTKNRGFAAMSPERQREIARRGGRAAHLKGTAHQFNSREAQLAGRKGGKVVSRDRRHMAEIGRKGGEAGGKKQGTSVTMRTRTLTSSRATSTNKRQLATAGRR